MRIFINDTNTTNINVERGTSKAKVSICDEGPFTIKSLR